jgi:RimJ/RimL family protein N-acetyltransferase
MTEPHRFPRTIETERLRLDRLDEATSALELYEHVKAGAPDIEDVTEYLTWGPHETPNETREFLERVTERWVNGESAEYAIVPREGEPGAGEFAGVGGMFLDWGRRTGTFGLWLRKPFWGRGYSAERATAFLALAFDRLDLDLVAVTHTVENDRSRQAIEKYVDRFGGRREGRFRSFETDPDGGGVDFVRHTVAHDEWSENRPDHLGVRFER